MFIVSRVNLDNLFYLFEFYLFICEMEMVMLVLILLRDYLGGCIYSMCVIFDDY